MQFEIVVTRTESETLRVFAPNRDDALKGALLTRPGTQADIVTEIVEGEPGESFIRQAECETCGKGIWDDEEYVEDDDGYYCMGCAAKRKFAECQHCTDEERMQCHAKGEARPGGPYYLCTRMKGHEGPHIACGRKDHAVFQWES